MSFYMMFTVQVPFLPAAHHGPESDLHGVRGGARGHLRRPHRGHRQDAQRAQGVCEGRVLAPLQPGDHQLQLGLHCQEVVR